MSMKRKLLLTGGILAILGPVLANSDLLSGSSGWSAATKVYTYDRYDPYQSYDRYDRYGDDDRWRQPRPYGTERVSYVTEDRWRDNDDWQSESPYRAAAFDRPAVRWTEIRGRDDSGRYDDGRYAREPVYDHDYIDTAPRYDGAQWDDRWREPPVWRTQNGWRWQQWHDRYETYRERPWRRLSWYDRRRSDSTWRWRYASSYWRPGYFWRRSEHAYVPWYGYRNAWVSRYALNMPYRNGYFNPKAGYFVRLHNSRRYHGFGADGLYDHSDPRRSFRTVADREVFWDSFKH